MAGEALKAPAGLLRPQGYGEAVRLFREPAEPPVESLVELYWSVAWSLPEGEVRTQETLPYPSVHLVVEDGRALVYGVPRARFTRRLDGSGSVLGIKFHPGGFRPLTTSRISSLRGRVVAAEDVLIADTRPLVETVSSAQQPVDQAAAAQFWLTPLATPDPSVEEAKRAVAYIADNPSVVLVEDLASRLNTSNRSLQRLFTDYVGVGPKWVVRRFRMHEAADRAASGPVDWARLALDLGYYDQSHFVRDFTAAVGIPPARYAAEVRGPETARTG
jgi:AraC-like DNA-binding protein